MIIIASKKHIKFFTHIIIWLSFATSISLKSYAIEIQRLDKDILLCTDENSAEYHNTEKKYGSLFNVFIEYFLCADSTQNRIKAFAQDSLVIQLYHDRNIIYPSLKSLEDTLEAEKVLFNKYLPRITYPNVAAHISYSNQSLILTDNFVSIGLNHYYGTDYPLYKRIYHDYESATKNPWRIKYDVAEAIIESEAEYSPLRHNLLSVMVHDGTILYCLMNVVPNASESSVLGYNESQLKWCRDNEQSIWEYIVSEDQLMSNNAVTITKYISPAPFTSPLSPESPGRVGRWIGLQIVKAYMKKNPNCNLEQLLEIKGDAASILKGSEYEDRNN